MLVSMKEIVDHAYAGGYGVTAPNVFNEGTIRAAIQAAEENNSPMILDFAYGMFADATHFRDVVEIARRFAIRSTIPVALNLDHGGNMEEVAIAINAGITSVMVDRSSKPFDENVAEVAEVVKFAHACGVSVEAELGHVGTGISTDSAEVEAGLTDPNKAKEYIDKTGIDCLAVAVGTIHGEYKGDPHIRFELLDKIKNVANLPLVLHGGSGSGDENLAKACTMGVTKINLFTDLSNAGIAKMREFGLENKIYACDLERKYFLVGYKEKLVHYMKLFGQCNKAW